MKKLILFSLMSLLMISCKKEKSPELVTPTPSSVLVTTGYHFKELVTTTYNNNPTHINITDSLGILVYTEIPINYGPETIHLFTGSTYINGYPVSGIYQHTCLNMPSRIINGSIYRENDSIIRILFEESTVPYSIANIINSYDVRYVKD